VLNFSTVLLALDPPTGVVEIMIEISCTVTIESFHLMTFILENVLFAINYFIVTTGTLIPSTTTAGPVSTKSSPKVASVSLIPRDFRVKPLTTKKPTTDLYDIFIHLECPNTPYNEKQTEKLTTLNS
jgi:hypothetical protein